MSLQYTVTIAQALATPQSGLLVQDTAAAIAAALPNASLVSRVYSFSLTANALINAASADKLAALGSKFQPAGTPIVVQDTVAAMNASANAAGLALATTRQIVDAAYNILSAPSGDFLNIASVTLTGEPTLSMAQLTKLEGLPGFSVQSGSSLVLQDSLSDFVPVLSAHPSWFAPASSLSVRLDGSQIGAAGVASLASLINAGKNVSFVAGASDTTLNVTAAAHDLATDAAMLNQLSGMVGVHITVSNEGSAVSAADAMALIGITGFSAAAHTLYVSDTGAAIAASAASLFGHGFPEILVSSGNFIGTAAQLLDHSLHVAPGATVAMTGSATLSAAQTQTLALLPGFALAGGASLTVSDTIADILANASGLSAATSIQVTDSETVSASSLAVLALVAAAHPGHFSLGGHSVSVADTAANLAAVPAQDIGLASSFALSAPALVTAAQFVTLRDALHVALGGNTLTIQDSAAHLLGLSGSLSLAAACMLSGAATVSAAAAQTLSNEPNFSTGGYVLTIADTAVNLLNLSSPLQNMASSLTLSGAQTITASQLAGLVALGSKFGTGGQPLTVAGSASDLASLTAPELALVTATMLNASATLNAAGAQALCALPGFVVANGAALTVQDSTATLLTLPGAVLAAAAVEKLAPGAVTLSAAQAAGLHALPHFSTSGSTITVSDTVANLNAGANTGWRAVAASTQVADQASILAANAGTTLLQNAGSVTLSGNGTVNAAQAVALNAIPSYSSGSYALTVSDGAVAIAANEAAILQIATTAVVTDMGPVSSAQADQLALISAAGKLTFLGGDQLVVTDSYANLIASGNAAGLALANNVTIIDTAANLVAATQHNWGSHVPTYGLSGNAVLTGAQATTLAGLGVHFQTNGHSMSVLDTAANVLAATNALTTLGIAAAVTDSAANIGAHASALQALGAQLLSVQTNDTLPVSGAVAAALAPLAGKLTGAPLAVSDNAADISSNESALATLGPHVAVTVLDSAANVGAAASTIANLGNAVTVSLTDSAPVMASVAAALLPLAAHIHAGTALAVTDTASAIASASPALASLLGSLGTITLSSGTAVTVGQAAALQPLDTHLGVGVQLAVSGNAAAIAASHAILIQLRADGHVASITDAGDSAAAVAANAPGLNAAGALVSVSDTFANVNASLGGLAHVTGLTGITVSDVANPIFTQLISQYAADAGPLALVTNNHTIAIIDSAVSIEADLAAANSVIIGIPGSLTIATIGGVPLVLPQSVALSPSVSAILPQLTTPLQVFGVDVAHLGAVEALSPQSITLTDTAAHIQADLTAVNSALVADIANIAGITVVPSGTITLPASVALSPHVDDGAHSVFALMSGATLAVTGALVSQVASLQALAPASIAVNDTAANITAALTNPNSPILTSPNTIVSLHVSDGAPIVLTEAQDMASGVNDSPHAALTKLSGGPVDVTGVLTSQLAAVEGTAHAPTIVNLSDTGGNIAAALPTLLTDLPNLGAINVTSGTVTLTAAQALTPHVADGQGSLVSLLPGQAYTVAGATIAQVAQLAALAQPPSHYLVTDTSANLAADLTAPFSQWAAHSPFVSVIGGVLTLTDAQADFLNAGALNRAGDLFGVNPGQTVDITGVPIADLNSLAGYAGSLQSGVTLHLEVADTAQDLAADLASNTSQLQQQANYVHSVTLTASGGTLTPAALDQVAGIAGLVVAHGVTVPVTGGAQAVAGLTPAALAIAGAVTVQDSSANVNAELDALQATLNGHLSITLTDNSPSISVGTGQYVADAPTIAAITNPGCLNVNGGAAAIAGLEPQLAVDPHLVAANIADSAANVVGNLGAIQALGGFANVTLTDNATISASLATALVSANLAHLSVGSLIVADTGSQIAAMAETGNPQISFLETQGSELTGNAAVTLVDALALNALGGTLNQNHSSIEIWDTAAHLTQPGAAAELANLQQSGFTTGIYLKTNGGAVTLTAATAVTLLDIPQLNIQNPDASQNLITVADTAAHLNTDFNALQSDIGSIANIVVDASATVNYAALTNLQALDAVTSGGVALTLADTAANILAASMVNAPTIQASAWNLSASASVSVTDAINLAVLPNFSAGAYTLTVALNNDQPISVNQANLLGGLGSSLVVTGHDLTLSGSVSSLLGLTTAGATVAHVALTDTLEDIASLSPTSPLLTGSVTISDSDQLSAASTTSFLALMSAAHVASVSFGIQTEYVVDSVAALRTLESSAAWTGNAGLQSHFELIADDTASVLSNPANASFLNGLNRIYLSATSNVSAATAEALASLHNFSLNGNGLIVSDSAANLLASANSGGVALATTVTLNGPTSVAAAGAESLLQLGNFHLTQPLSITDSSANLLDGTLSGLIAGHSLVQVALAGAETLDAQTAAALVGLQGFNDTTDMHIVDSSSYLLAPSATAAELMAASVSLDGNEVVSANTILRLSEVPHFVAGGGQLILAGNDFANAATLNAIGSMGSNFNEGGHSLTLTQDDLALTPTEYAAIQQDGFVANGHAISALLSNTHVTDNGNLLSLSATGVAGSLVNIYGSTGSLVSSTHEGNAGFTVTAPDLTGGASFSITEVVAGVESAPVVVLDANALESLVAQTSIGFSSSGEIQVDSGKYINLYTAGTPLPNAPALVYDPHAHTISLDIPNSAPVTLITLGASTSPASIDPTEILVKHHNQ